MRDERCKTCGSHYVDAPGWLDFDLPEMRVCDDKFHARSSFFLNWAPWGEYRPKSHRFDWGSPKGEIIGASVEDARAVLILALEKFIKELTPEFIPQRTRGVPYWFWY